MDDPDNEDKGLAYINFDTSLTLNRVADHSKVWWCALILKIAGTKVSYDCGLCYHELDREIDSIELPNDEESEL